jgi:DNA repair protein RecO (recombination protein O)
MATPNHRQENQRVYILHTYPFKETSLIAEVFTEKFGRIPVVAKGARRPDHLFVACFNPFKCCLRTGQVNLNLKV